MGHTLPLENVRSLFVANPGDSNFRAIAFKVEDQPHASHFYRQNRT
jgi:hypothetical protein